MVIHDHSALEPFLLLIILHAWDLLDLTADIKSHLRIQKHGPINAREHVQL